MSDPKKRIVLCFDGTSQASNHGREEVPSNATKLSLSLERWFTNDDGVRSPQIVYYDSGVGTDEVGEIGKDFTAGLGKTLDQKVCEAYHFIATNYCDGDELYFFGFSRGAFTARATAGLICRVGICTREDLSQFWKMWAVYTHLPSSGDIKTTKWYEPVKPGGKIIIEIHGTKKELIEGEGKDWIDRTQKSLDNLNIQVVGVWDTVGSLGLPRNQFIDVDYWNKQHQFYNTEIHPKIKNAFHALALDEHRMTFSPVLWTLPPGETKTNLIQCWFPGVHINIGGGSDNKNGDLEFLANTTFAWMVDRCLPLLDFSLERVINLLESHDKSVQGLIKQYAQTGQTGTFWTGGPLLDSFKGLVYRTQGSLVRTPGTYYTDPITNECIHPIVHYMQENCKSYKSKALEGFERKPNNTTCGFYFEGVRTKSTYQPIATKIQSLVSRGWSWVTRRARNHIVEKYEVRIPEFVMPGSVDSRSGDVPNARGYMCSVEKLLMIVSARVIIDNRVGLTQRMRDDNMGELETYLDRLLEANDGVLGPRMMDENPQTRQSKDWSEVVKSFPKPLLRV